MNNEAETTNSQCSALSHTSLWPQNSVRKKKPTQVINRGNLSTILLWTTSVDFILSSCYRVVNGPLERISSDLALDTLAEGITYFHSIYVCLGGSFGFGYVLYSIINHVPWLVCYSV
ncbi:unnamed protein product [Brassica napus]|uniref:(rape) hypothetical protein n=1 Tax=Brassica napus TaxID=3708 RepID=A0A816LX20_BRANA|nr:unnamed protein product [Brassica napus]